jgi:hypothetical protein
MRLVAVSIVKNEADIIEAFVRHTAAWVDHHLIFDHDSTDGTREILRALQSEGLSVSLFRDDAPGHLQQARSNHLTRLAASNHGADWILPLDADEMLNGPGRPELEACLQAAGTGLTVNLPLLDYCATPEDDANEANPALRLRYCRPGYSVTRKIFLPRDLALDPEVLAGKGSHALYRGTTALPSQSLPIAFHLAHLAMRSPQQQVLRVVRAELQRLCRGQAAAGLDEHYRLGFQLLAEEPDLFFSTVHTPTTGLRLQPIHYQGGPIRHAAAHDWSRVARALLPTLEQIAISHGRLADALGVDVAPPAPTNLQVSEISRAPQIEETPRTRPENFIGFAAASGWGPREGPVPEAFLPPFHWGYAPATHLVIEPTTGPSATLLADLLTYSPNQTVRIELNGTLLRELTFVRINERARLTVPLPTLHSGRNDLVIRYSQNLVTDHDARRLAVIFLTLRIVPGAAIA